MDFESITTAAYNNEEMPPNLNSAEQRLFQSLRYLYSQHRAGWISPEQGVREKSKILEAYEMDCLFIQANADAIKIRRTVGYLLNEKSECEVCQQVGMVLDGREKML